MQVPNGRQAPGETICVTGRIVPRREDAGRIEEYPGTHLVFQQGRPTATVRADSPAIDRQLWQAEAQPGEVTVCGEDRGIIAGLPHIHVRELRWDGQAPGAPQWRDQQWNGWNGWGAPQWQDQQWSGWNGWGAPQWQDQQWNGWNGWGAPQWQGQQWQDQQWNGWNGWGAPQWQGQQWQDQQWNGW